MRLIDAVPLEKEDGMLDGTCVVIAKDSIYNAPTIATVPSLDEKWELSKKIGVEAFKKILKKHLIVADFGYDGILFTKISEEDADEDEIMDVDDVYALLSDEFGFTVTGVHQICDDFDSNIRIVCGFIKS